MNLKIVIRYSLKIKGHIALYRKHIVIILEALGVNVDKRTLTNLSLLRISVHSKRN